MDNRTEAIVRVILGLPILFIGGIVVSWATILYVIAMAIDVVIVLVTGGKGLTTGNWLSQFFGWYVDLFEWVIWGDGTMNLLPYVGI